MQIKKVIALTICFVMAMSMALTLRQTYAADEAIYVDPASTTAVLNNDYTIQIKVNATDLYGWEFKLDYDHTILDLTDAHIVTGTLNTPINTFHSETNTTTGHLWWAVSSIYPAETGVTVTDAAIFEIHFRTNGTGISTLVLSDTILADSNANAITHTTTDGSINIYGRDLTVTDIYVLDYGCSIYANDTDKDNNPYYYTVKVNVTNTGTLDAGEFDVKLQVYYDIVPGVEGTAEVVVAGLAYGASTNVTFATLVRPLHTKDYHLTATVDSQYEISEDSEANNSLNTATIVVTVIGDINHDGIVNILDAVVMSKAWDALSTDTWWNIKADINHSGNVTISDGARLGQHWGESW